jgi:hypothetical protein
MHLYDPRERELLPAVGLLRARDAETGKTQWIDTNSRRVRERYANWYAAHMDYFNTAFQQSRADTLSVETTEDYVKELLRFFQRRG